MVMLFLGGGLDLPAGPSRTCVSNDPSANEQFVIATPTFSDVENGPARFRAELVDSAFSACANITGSGARLLLEEKVETSAESLAIFKLTAPCYSEFESRFTRAATVRCPRCRLNITGGWPIIFAGLARIVRASHPELSRGIHCESLR